MVVIKMERENIKELRLKIISEANWLIFKADQIKKEAEREDCSFNSLGELQGNALNLDRIIITYETMKMCLK